MEKKAIYMNFVMVSNYNFMKKGRDGKVTYTMHVQLVYQCTFQDKTAHRCCTSTFDSKQIYIEHKETLCKRKQIIDHTFHRCG